MHVIEIIAYNMERHPAGCLLLTKAAHECRYKEGLEFYEGKEFFSRFLANFKAVHIKQPLWWYRQHSRSKTAERQRRQNGGTH